MNKRMLWSRVLSVIGMVAVIWAMDRYGDLSLVGPLVGGALIALSAFLVGSRFRRLACWGFGLIVTEYIVLNGPVLPAIWILFPSLPPGRPPWAPLVFVPWALGSIFCLVAGVRILSEGSHHGESNPSQTQTERLGAIGKYH
jgi:hypothetical protein